MSQYIQSLNFTLVSESYEVNIQRLKLPGDSVSEKFGVVQHTSAQPKITMCYFFPTQAPLLLGRHDYDHNQRPQKLKNIHGSLSACLYSIGQFCDLIRTKREGYVTLKYQPVSLMAAQQRLKHSVQISGWKISIFFS
uniref:Uncharacterized protein n=1 Tax=Setaria viridis TaxID=4556 RepID=A0A4U6UHZ9_SETVI|nr:hypothetical protein SEVIR_5G262000v2 [Setaria viridis]